MNHNEFIFLSITHPTYLFFFYFIKQIAHLHIETNPPTQAQAIQNQTRNCNKKNRKKENEKINKFTNTTTFLKGMSSKQNSKKKQESTSKRILPIVEVPFPDCASSNEQTYENIHLI